MCGLGAYHATNMTLQWRLPIALSCFWPLALGIGLFFVPESPRYLAWVNRYDDAWSVIQKIHHDVDDPTESSARAEFTQITKQVEYDKEQKTGYVEMFRKPSWRKRSLLVMFLMFASQSTGVLGITNYSVVIYDTLGMKGQMPLVMYCIYTILGTLPNYVGSYFMDRIGRRRLLLIGFPLCAINLLIEALLQRQYVGTGNKSGNAAALAWVYVYIICYGFCLDPAQVVWCSEIFPTTLRAKGIGLTFFSYFVGGITYTTPGATAFRVIQWRMYMIWFACSVVSSIIVYFFIPETSKLPVEEIGALFGDEVVIHLSKDGHGILESDKLFEADMPEVAHVEKGAQEPAPVAEVKSNA